MMSSRNLLLLLSVFASNVVTHSFTMVQPRIQTPRFFPAVAFDNFHQSSRRSTPIFLATPSSGIPLGGESEDETSPSQEEGTVQRIKKIFAPPDDGLSFRQRLAKMGLAAALSYGFVSNMSYCVSVSLAWYIFSRQVSRAKDVDQR